MLAKPSIVELIKLLNTCTWNAFKPHVKRTWLTIVFNFRKALVGTNVYLSDVFIELMNKKTKSAKATKYSTKRHNQPSATAKAATWSLRWAHQWQTYIFYYTNTRLIKVYSTLLSNYAFPDNYETDRIGQLNPTLTKPSYMSHIPIKLTAH